MCGFYNVNNSKFGLVDNLVVPASRFGKQTQTYDGVDLVLNARIARGGFVTGGMSKGRTVTDNCNVLPDSPQAVFCHSNNPQMQFKVGGNLPLPWWGLQVAGAFFNTDGINTLASYVATNAQVLPSLGRNLGNCAPAAATCAATVTIPALINPNSVREPRQSQLDLRLSKVITVKRLRMTPNFDVFNVLNANNVLAQNSSYSAVWRTPSSIVGGRLIKLSVLVDF